ncbi:MAG TPA: NADPH:quinone reductase [Segeticoccus sp.]|uniref:NADPH:quinone reductase n=1 Tax=Segeticoccus sp. TaxID=2706531 RepID=UPI002D7E6AD3|nr:NADPH:quinone reductase [Segeticoccus sp.]HET8599621.1 NADPH:quinone reductase [Segeticoccus sp.]
MPDTPRQMLAACIDRPGPAESIALRRIPVPVPGGDEVLVRVGQVTVDPVDTYVRSGRYPTPLPSPFVIGRDLVGTAEAAGTQDSGFAPGDRVWCNSLGHEGRQGSFAEYAVVPRDRLYHLPEGVDPATAVAVAHLAATAYLGWFVHARLRPGETVFVGGAAGNIGTAAVQLATAAGARVVATAKPADHDRCRRAGADVVLDYHDEQLADAVAQAAPDGVDVLWETSGHHDPDLVAAVLVPGGRVLVTAAADPTSAAAWASSYTKDVATLGFVMSRARVEDLAAAADLINTMLADGRLTARITERGHLAEAAGIHARLEAGQLSGRAVLEVP